LLDRAHRNQTDTSVQSEMRDLGRRELAPPHSEGLCWPSLAAAVHTTMTRGIAALRYAGSENAPKSFRAFVPRCAGGAAGVPLGPDLYERNPKHRFPSGICGETRNGPYRSDCDDVSVVYPRRGVTRIMHSVPRPSPCGVSRAWRISSGHPA
jgi:hypothetical protein